MKRNIVGFLFYALLIGGSLTSFTLKATNNTSAEQSFASYYDGVPFKTEILNRPQFPDRTLSITSTGAVGDGLTDNTDAINQAIKQIAELGGGKVVIPAGVWSTGPIRLLSNVNLHAEVNAIIVFNPDHTLYPIIETSFEGLNTRRSTSPIYAKNEQNIAITGEGVFDGSGDAWRFVKKEKLTTSQWNTLINSGGVVNEKKDAWYPSEESLRGHRVSDMFNNPQNLETDAEWEAIHHWLRPVFVSLVGCKNVLLEGVTFRNSPCWSIHPLSCENFIMNRVRIFNPWYSQNGDGLDLESCNKALIINNLFDVGDDAMCIKSGKDKDGWDRNEPCRNVIIRNNTVLHGHGGFVVGSEMSGGVNNIYVKDCSFLGTDVGLRFKSTRGRGGLVENIWIEDIQMIDIPTEPLLFDLFYSGKSAMEDLQDGKEVDTRIPEVTKETPSFQNIFIKRVTCKNARRAMYFNGLPEMKIKNVQIEDVHISSKFGAEIIHAEDVSLQGVKIIPETGSPVILKHTSNITVNNRKFPDTKNKELNIKD
ncbi:glycoside hydrolase family 28 protein [Massilibacteroides vaginae]|uniref:glycoside hydrolase family 28 protein n=1 Tax=Massilibacteroides vaginae TaxID=1673718 RepID=UPI000A1CB1DF|nr:glycoside hydrolase family 28 protein [Massilibacteroides vaginae]